LGGAWTSKRFNSEAAAWQLFQGLRSEPTLILESTLEGENLSISYAYWGLGDVKPRYDTCMRFSWLEVLYGFVKERTENWFRNRAEEGTSEAEWIDHYGEEFVAKYQANQAVIKREQMWLDRGDDIRELSRNYNIVPKDWEQLKGFVALCHIMIAGWVTDEYFLLNTSPERHLSPLSPELLTEWLSGMSEATKRQFTDSSVQVYQALYEALIRQVPDWEPELRLELATSLIKLPNHDAGLAQINVSLKVWLFSRGVDWQSGTPVLLLLSSVAKPEDEAYFRSLYQVWELVGINDKVDMGSAYYQRGESFLKRRDYSAAYVDFERAIALGHTDAVQRRELVVHLQEHISDEKCKSQEVEKEAALVKQQQVETVETYVSKENQQIETLGQNLESRLQEAEQAAALAQKQADEVERRGKYELRDLVLSYNKLLELYNREREERHELAIRYNKLAIRYESEKQKRDELEYQLQKVEQSVTLAQKQADDVENRGKYELRDLEKCYRELKDHYDREMQERSSLEKLYKRERYERSELERKLQEAEQAATLVKQNQNGYMISEFIKQAGKKQQQ
jgi:hypothetical protein